MTSPTLAFSKLCDPLAIIPVFLAPAPPTVTVLSVSVVKLAPPLSDPAPIVDFGPGFNVAEAAAVKVVATECDAAVVTRTSPTPAQNPPRALTAVTNLGSAVWAKLAHVATALSKAVGHQELELT